jgi:starch-binding outer membrane protein, SusD/RagB family
MNFQLKKYIFLFACATLLLSACDKQLDLQPQQSIDASTALNTPLMVKAAITGTYGIIREAEMFGGDIQLSADLLAGNDDMDWLGTFQTYRDIYRKRMVAENGVAQGIWIRSYQAINTTNSILDAINIITDPAEQKQVKGEALFLRAIAHFELVRLFAKQWDVTVNNTADSGIPIVIKVTKSPEDLIQQKRNTIAEVYAQVIADLTQAKLLLNTTNLQAGRANSYTASGYLARVYLQKADYANALVEANRIIVSNNYSLTTDVATPFVLNNTTEAIFELQQTLQSNAGQANAGLATFYAGLDGIGRADIDVTNITTLYETADIRLSNLFYISTDGSNRPGNTCTGKWADPTKNYVLMRLAEMFLIRAECNFRNGTSIGATPYADLDEVRFRADASEIVTPNLNDITNERILELCFEGHRVHDIRRLKGSFSTYQHNDPKLLLPIPRRELNANPNLVQNTGY